MSERDDPGARQDGFPSRVYLAVTGVSLYIRVASRDIPD